MAEKDRLQKVLLAVGVASLAFGAALLYLTRDVDAASATKKRGKQNPSQQISAQKQAVQEPIKEDPELDYAQYDINVLRELYEELELEYQCIIARNYAHMLRLKQTGVWEDEMILESG